MSRTWQVIALCATAAAVAACGPQAATSPSAQHHMDMNMHMKMNTKAGAVAPVASVGVQRKYYIAADPVLWDYAPDGQNDITGAPFTAEEQVFTKQGANRIGHRYWKSLYRGYTDATFSHQIARPTSCAPVARACDDSLGMLGPVIRATVGDTIQVVFKNNTAYPASIHPHGVFYQKDSEGAPYSDGTSGADKSDDAVPPGGTHTYNWQVPDRAGPGPMDGSSVLWMYHSHTDEVADTNAGLVGPMVITARGKGDPATGAPLDVDKEVFTYFTVENENNSQYLDRNLQELAGAPHQISTDDADAFEESNLMHSINGYVFGNGPVPTLQKGSRVLPFGGSPHDFSPGLLLAHPGTDSLSSMGPLSRAPVPAPAWSPGAGRVFTPGPP